MHLQCGIGSVDDCHKLQKKRPPEDAVVSDVETSHLKRQHLPTLVVPYPTGYLQFDAFNGCG
jgi:hypothetical protein